MSSNGYNPNSKQKYYNLTKELEGKNSKDILWMSQKIIKMLASDRINLDTDGYHFLSKPFTDILINYAYKKVVELYWDTQSYNSLINSAAEGRYIIADQDLHQVVSLRNKKNMSYKAYTLVCQGLTEIRETKNFRLLIQLSQAMKDFKDYY